jgi:hypothetical protein
LEEEFVGKGKEKGEREKSEKLGEKMREKPRASHIFIIYIDLVSLWGYLWVYVCMGVYIMCI